MDPRVARLCADALGLSPEAVAELHDGAELLPALLAASIVQQRRQPPAGAEFCRAVWVGYGPAAFTAAELIAWSEEMETPERRAVRDATRSLCGAEEVNATSLGMHLGNLAPRVECVGKRRGVKVWSVRDQRD